MTTYANIYSGIYGIVNLTNDKLYIGSAINLKARKKTHFRKLRWKKHPNQHLQLSWNKYGEENFQFLFLDFCDKNELLTKEKEWIDLLEVCNKEKGYNKRTIPNSNLGMILSKEHRKKIGDGNRGKSKNKGRIVPDTERQKISIALKGRKHSPEHIAKRVAILTGRIKTKEEKRKISETLKKTSYFIGGISKEAMAKRVITVKNKSRWKCPDRAKCKCNWCKAVRRRDRRMRYLNECK